MRKKSSRRMPKTIARTDDADGEGCFGGVVAGCGLEGGKGMVLFWVMVVGVRVWVVV